MRVTFFWVVLALITFGVFMWRYYLPKADRRDAKKVTRRLLISSVVAMIIIVALMGINFINGV